MPKIKCPEHVEYLALEGGGGKGVVFLGAIRALQDMDILPIKTKNTDGFLQIKGISGSSAGAITALFLSMGATADEIEGELEKKAEFDSFFDDSQNGYYRVITEDGSLVKGWDYGLSVGNFKDMVKNRNEKLILPFLPLIVMSRISNTVNIIQDLTKEALSFMISRGLPEAIAKKLSNKSDFWNYYYNLIYDRGIFPGFSASHYFLFKMRHYLNKNFGFKMSHDSDKSVTFKELYEITKVELVITGTNVTKHRPLEFSHKLTPNMSVAGAVSISMNIPLLFKPIRVDYKNEIGSDPDKYKGFWVDGGLLHNLPLHAFDYYYTHPFPQFYDKYFSYNEPYKPLPDFDYSKVFFNDILPLHKGVLGLRLQPPEGKKSLFPKNRVELTLLAYLGDIVDAFFYSSEEGQIRTISEREQTIILNTGDLSTLEFSPPKSKSQPLQKAAEKKVNDYFSDRTGCQ